MKIKDDRGRTHDVSRIKSLPSELLNRADRRHELMRQLKRKSTGNVMYTETIGMLLLSVPFLFGVPGFVWGIRESESLGYLLFMFLVGGFGIVLLIAAVTRPRTLRREINRLSTELELLRQTDQTCLVCGYALEGLLAESDGCVVCPECGGAWSLGMHDGTAAQE